MALKKTHYLKGAEKFLAYLRLPIFKSTLLDILLGGHQLPQASAWGLSNPWDLGFSPGLKTKAWAKAQCR
jgi:hypothetical protein